MLFSISPPDKKNGKTNGFGGIVGIDLDGFGGHLRVFWGGFWKVFGGVFRRFVRVI